MYNGLKARYPNITYISTVFNENGNHMRLPPGTMWDTHHYEEPQFFIKRFHEWDDWQRTSGQTGVGVLLGEYSVFQVDTPSGQVNWSQPPELHVKYPRLLSAIAEGVYALGGERNPHTVWMSSYAPSLQRKEAASWTPNMIYFDSQEVILSPSYWQQWLFSRFRGSHNVNIRARGKFNPLYWGATIQENSGEVYLKVCPLSESIIMILLIEMQVINAGRDPVPLTVRIDQPYSTVNGTILTSGDINDFNIFGAKDRVVPRPIRGLQMQGGNQFQWTVPRLSLTVLHFRR
jgi:alpha-L-arabinofuranosidase